MKFSEAMLKGYEKVNGRQLFAGRYGNGDTEETSTAHCVAGAAMRGGMGYVAQRNAREAFTEFWGLDPASDLNDNRMPWEHIYGMAVAAGL